MNLNTQLTKLTRVIAVALLTSASALAIAGPANVSDHTAPMVSEKEAKMSFWDLPYLEKAYIDTTPNKRKDGIRVGELGVGKLDVNNGNKEMIIKFAKEIADKKHGLIDSLLISHKGELVFESYYRRGRVDLPHMQASSTKSYTALAVGRAIQLGYLTMADLDKPLVSFLKDLDLTKAIAGADTITLHNAMNMSSGIRISRDQLKEFNKNPEQLKGQGQIQTFLENSPPITKQSKVFHYQSSDPRMVMQVLDAVVPGNVEDFIKKELLDKMGISQYAWREDTSGLPMAPFGSKMTPRNMLKWGALVMNNGKYNGEQLIPAAFIDKATNAIAHPNDEQAFFNGDNISTPGYGYYFWQADMKAGNKKYFTKSAQGGGGQYIIMIDELDLMVVFTAHERDDKTMKITADRVLPAFVD